MRWVERALCSPRRYDAVDPEWWFADPGSWERELAEKVCVLCPVREECLAYALPRPELVGVWGGLTASQRDQARRAARGPVASGEGRHGVKPISDRL